MKLISPNDLHTDDFLIESGKVHIKKTLNRYNLMYNELVTEEDDGGPYYESIFVDNKGRTNDAANRLYLHTLGGLGKIHIDGKFTNEARYADVIAYLPDGAPRPLALIEAGVYIGDHYCLMWVDGGSNEVKTSGAPIGKRIVLDLVGFFV